MLKILLVYDDFQELTAIELVLKKIGFDVVGVTSEFSLSEQLLSFNPQVVVAQGKSAKVSTVSVGRRLRESVRWDGQCVLIFYPQAKPQPQDLLKIRIDVGLEYPVDQTKMIQVLAQLGNLDAHVLLDKLAKSMASEMEAAEASAQAAATVLPQDSVFVSGGQADGDAANTVGGAANFESSLEMKGEKPAPESVTTVTPPPASQKAGSPPLFPLGNQEFNRDTKSVNGGSNSNSNSTPVSGGGGLEFNPFQMDSMPQDPLLQELEGLLKKKPDLSLNPPIVDKQRHQKYEQYLKSIPIQDLSSIKKREAKSRLRDLVKDIEIRELQNQDGLRQEFVKALFKKDE